jgi:heptosyltransferase I
MERALAERIAGATGAGVWDRLPLRELANRLGASRLAIGVDSGLSHLAAALGVSTLALFGATDVRLTGCRGARVRNLQAAFACSPCLGRVCGYPGAGEIWQGVPVHPACYARLPPDRIWRAAEALADADRVLHL